METCQVQSKVEGRRLGSTSVGVRVGVRVGVEVGRRVGETVGRRVGIRVGSCEFSKSTWSRGETPRAQLMHAWRLCDGMRGRRTEVGDRVGRSLGARLGMRVGAVGTRVGDCHRNGPIASNRASHNQRRAPNDF